MEKRANERDVLDCQIQFVKKKLPQEKQKAIQLAAIDRINKVLREIRITAQE